MLASTEWSGVEPPDVEHGDMEALIEAYPDFHEHILNFHKLSGCSPYEPRA